MFTKQRKITTPFFILFLSLAFACFGESIQFNAKIPVDVDEYVCLVKEVDYSQDVHVTEFVHDYNEDYVHHALMMYIHEASSIFDAGQLFAPENDLGFGSDGTMSFICPQIGTSVDGLLSTISYRVSSINAWERGMKPVVLPEDAGFLLGPTHGRKFVIAQFHIHSGHGGDHMARRNTEEKKVHINTELITTTTLRPYNAASFLMIVPDQFIAIPPNSVEHEVSVTTDAVPFNNPCYGPALPFPVHPWSTFSLTGAPFAKMFHSHLHSHGNGKRMSLEVLRGGDIMSVDTSYRVQADFQALHNVDFTILPTDRVRLTCTYNTEGKHHVVNGGLRSDDEMCILFSLVYPSGPLNYSGLDFCGVEINNVPNTGNLTHCNVTPAPCWQWWL